MDKEAKSIQKWRMHTSLQAQHKKRGWYVDSGCSKHMTERKEMDQSPLEIKIHPKSLEKAQFEFGTRMKMQKNVLLVKDMKHNLLSVS